MLALCASAMALAAGPDVLCDASGNVSYAYYRMKNFDMAW